jgi:hypothetical protein
MKGMKRTCGMQGLCGTMCVSHACSHENGTRFEKTPAWLGSCIIGGARPHIG